MDRIRLLCRPVDPNLSKLRAVIILLGTVH